MALWNHSRGWLSIAGWARVNKKTIFCFEYIDPLLCIPGSLEILQVLRWTDKFGGHKWQWDFTIFHHGFSLIPWALLHRAGASTWWKSVKLNCVEQRPPVHIGSPDQARPRQVICTEPGRAIKLVSVTAKSRPLSAAPTPALPVSCRVGAVQYKKKL